LKLSTVKAAETILQSYIPQVNTYTGDNMSLDRVYPLLEKLGNPQNNLKVVHIAGTSGKTSTAYYIAAQLQASKLKVGLTVSPHIDSITERFQINGVPITDTEFCSELGLFLDAISASEIKPSYFELLIVFVYWYFNRQKVDYAVVETGMGGLLDATNVVTQKNKICVITDIGFDHMHILGSTLDKIADQKAGIIQNENQVFMYKQSDVVMNQILKRTTDNKATLNVYSYDDLVHSLETKLVKLPNFQKRNWLLARQVTRYISNRDNLSLPEELSAENVVVPARMETIRLPDSSLLIMDGAHNGQKMEAFAASFKLKYPKQKTVIMLSLKKGKEFQEVIDALMSITDKIILTTFDTSQDLPATAQDTEVIAQYCKKRGIVTVIVDDNKKAAEMLLQQKNNIKIITGSFYLIGQVRKKMQDILH